MLTKSNESVQTFCLILTVVCCHYCCSGTIVCSFFSQLKDIHGKTSDELDLVSHCPYRMAIKASTRGGETPWSEEKLFGMVTLPYSVFVHLAAGESLPSQQLKAPVHLILLPSSGYFKNSQTIDKKSILSTEVVHFFLFL